MFFIFLASGIFIFSFATFKFWEDKRQKITGISRFFSIKDYQVRRSLQRFLVSWRSIKRSLRLFFLVEAPFFIRRVINKNGSRIQKRFKKIKDDIRGKYLQGEKSRTTSKYLKEISEEKNPSVVLQNKPPAVIKEHLNSGSVRVETPTPPISAILKPANPKSSDISVKELIAIKKISSASALKAPKHARGKSHINQEVPASLPKIKRKPRKRVRGHSAVQSSVLVRTGPEGDVMNGELVIIENLRRGYLDPVARAKAFTKLSSNFNLKHTQIAEKIGKSREHVSNTLRILSLPDTMLEALKKGKITEGHTRPLLMLQSRPAAQESLFKEIVAGDLTVREAETISRKVATDRLRKLASAL
ncbi:MAG: ParB/RepB/Spo0J family partition protein [Patescibacteria group bacterium]